MESRQIYKKMSKEASKQIRIDKELHRQLKMKSADTGESMKSLLEDALMVVLSVAPSEENK